MTSKTTREGADTVQTVTYDYNLQNRFATVTTTPYVDNVAQTFEVVEYAYNSDGIRTRKTVDGTLQTDYLIDPANPTGYAQVLEEWTYDISNPASPVVKSAVFYTLGDDVIAQTRAQDVSGTWTFYEPEYLLYDGHGSTRQLARPDTSVIDSYSYDAYGVMLSSGSGAAAASSAATSLLYAGEQYDGEADQYYLRARYYAPSTGRFNSMDSYVGNSEDPQSLHKYLYCHANPINNGDPLGLFSLPEINLSLVINTAMRAWTGYSIIKTVKKACQEGLSALTFFDWLFLGLDVLHVSSALTWIKMTSTWKKQAKLFHSLGEKLSKAVGRAVGAYAGQLGTRMHEALKASWLGQAVRFVQRQLAAYGVEIYIDEALGTGIGGRPDITIVLRKLKIGIAFDMKAVPKTIFYSGILPSYQWLYEQSGTIKNQREGTIKILDREFGVNCLYFYIPYPSFVL